MPLLQPNTERRPLRYGGNQCKPPDALILSPVNHAASSEARKTTAGATSSGRPNRAPSGGVAAAPSASGRPTKPIRRLTSLSIRHGATVLTWIFRGPNSFESASVIVSIAPLVAE